MISYIYSKFRKDKTDYIKQARNDIELIRLYIRLCKDLQVINMLKFIEINVLIESISKQLYAWWKN